MVEIETSVAHQLGNDAALNRLHDMVDSLQSRYRDQVHGVESIWNGNELDISFDAYGYKIVIGMRQYWPIASPWLVAFQLCESFPRQDRTSDRSSRRRGVFKAKCF